MKPHGLAWGETGEGRNPIAWYLNGIYDGLVGDDAEWAYPAEHGFRWWPYQQAQEISVVQCGDDPAFEEVVRIRVATEVRASVQPTPVALIAIVRRNATLAESALVLRDDGTLILACQFVMTEVLADGAQGWIQDLAIRQFITARELGAELAELGTDATSAHPVSGPRPEPDVWFGQFAEEMRKTGEAKRDDMPESRPQVALLAAGGQYALPYRMAARDGGVLELSWRSKHIPDTVPVDLEIRVTAAPGTDEAGPAWTIRSHMPVAGDDADKARWCNERNAELLLASEPPMELMVFGGWGLTPDGDCCLTAGQSRRSVRDNEKQAARKLGYLLREEQMAVVAALRAAPEAVREAPLTAAELATGLDSVRATFGRILGERQDLAWATEPDDTHVLVTCGEITMAVPVGYGRAQLALVYGELLVSFPNGRSWLSLYALFPEPTVDLGLEKLQREGLLWVDEDGRWVFDAGQTHGRLETVCVRETRRFGAIQALRVAGISDDPGIGRFGMTIPPAQFAWDIQPAAMDVLAWVTRHVIGQVREAARQQELSREPVPAGAPRLFGSGQYAAAALRGRLLELLGAEPEWMVGDYDSPGIVWNSGLATTMFEVTEGADGTPDLGVLRVYTPIATAGNGNTARDVCMVLNASTATARWSVAREPDADGSYYDEVQVSCAFVVGPHNQDTLESLALWCVREQIGAATAHIHSRDVAEAVAGVYSRYTGFPAGDDRVDRHPVVSFTERIVQPSASLSADGLAEELLAAFRGLREMMFDERTSAWFAYHDELPLTCETPFSWDLYPQGLITHMRSDDDPEDKPLTALIESEIAVHPVLGNGLRITVHVPRDPRGDIGRALNALNRLDAKVVGASHSFGGWTMTEKAPACVIFLPAAFAESVANMPLVMREILLMLARQALLARRVLVPADQRSAEDRGSGLGLAVAADPLATFVRGPHGLAWGETGEGRNPAARVLDQIYGKCVGPDTAWADTRADGFTWWPYQQAQNITATLRSANDVQQGVTIRIATEVRRSVPVTDESLLAVAALNAELTQSALVLRDDGRLDLACRLYVHEGIDHWANKWAQMLAAEQFIAARELSERLDAMGLGEAAISGHPFSGLRPEPDELFGIRENFLIAAAANVETGLSPIVPLLAIGRPYALPHHLSAADEAGGLDFTWHPSQTHADLPVDPAIQVSVRRGDCGSGPGWMIRSYVPVSGDPAAKARWCNDRNAGQLGDDDGSGDDLTVVGGWGLAPDGECCLTTWMSPFFVQDEVEFASGLVGNLLVYHESTVVTALRDEPNTVTGAPLTPEELARGLESVLTTFGGELEYPADYQWSVEARAADVVVSLTGTSTDDAPLAEADESSFRTVLRIPLARNRAELGLLYAAFLGRSVTRVPTSGPYDLIPGESWNWDFTWMQIEEALGVIDGEGILDWDNSQGAFVFDSGEGEALLRVERLAQFRPNGSMALRLIATVPDMSLAALRDQPASDITIVGTWTQAPAGVSYTVTIPPAATCFGSDFIVQELVRYVARHVVTHVQNAVQRRVGTGALSSRKPEESLPDRAGKADLRWQHDHGNGTGAIMSGIDLVASFSAEFLVADKYLQNQPPDRSEETQRNVAEGTATLAVSEKGEQDLIAWVARKWQAQLDTWWMYGEPVFWCEHIRPDDDEQPLLEWFMRFPGAMECDQCADRIRAALLTGKSAAICSSCGKETAETVFGRTPGLSVIANYGLCSTCAALFAAVP